MKSLRCFQLIIIYTVAQLSVAQQFSISPIIGMKYDVSRIPFEEKHLDIPDPIINLDANWFIFNPNPIFGLRFELEKKRSKYAVGFLFNDIVSSSFNYSLNALIDGEKTKIHKTVYSGIRTVKIPISYQYQWFTSKNNKFAFNFHMGVNMVFSTRQHLPYNLFSSESFTLAEGLAANQTIVVNSYSIDIYQLNKPNFRFTTDIGVELSFRYRKNNRINMMLYFEKGYQNKGAHGIETEFLINGNKALGMGAGSFGSAFHFKLVVPILIKDFTEN